MPISIESTLFKINDAIVNPLILLMFALALSYFIFGLIKFISKASDETARTEGKKSMVWGIVGMFIMVAVGGILKLVLLTFGVDTDIGL